jgi:hypothetical protein
MSEETIKPIVDVALNSSHDFLTNFISWGTSFIMTIVKCVAMFTSISVGMVYFK